MDQFIHAGVTGLNRVGREFCSYAATLFLQVGVLVVILLAVDLLLRQRVRATVRYWIWMLVFLKLVLPPSLSAPTGIGYWCGTHVPPAPAVLRQFPETVAPHPVRAEAAAHEETRMPPMPRSDPDAASAGTERVGWVLHPRVTAGFDQLTWPGLVFLLWGTGVVVLGGWVIQRLFFVRKLIVQGQPVESDLLEVLDQCRRRMGIRRAVRLRVSPGTFSPAVCGLLRPTILIPAAVLDRLSPDHLRAVLIHELAHVQRADLWVNCLQTVLQVLYFYSPLVWLANAIARRVREQAVDERVLVALGAEAGSYSRTLIDMAEMAFGRTSSALGLVGVAESKKSLEGRIKHMITRPIPKSARVGVTGVLAIIVLGAAVLPMAAARTETPPAKFVARLSNGATLELVGVCHWPAQDPVCWKADGSPLDRDIHPAGWSRRPRADDYGFMVQVTGPEAPELSWGSIEGAQDAARECEVVDARSEPLEGLRAGIASLRNAAAATTVRIGVAAGPWTTLASHNGHGLKAHASKESKESILWSQAFEDSRGTHVFASTPWPQDGAGRRIVAVDTQGAVHTTAGSNSVAAGKVGELTEAVFEDLQRADIREFQYQARSYEWVEFDGVSLRPGHKSVVTVDVGAPDERTPRAGGALAGSDNATDRKAYSHTCLANLGKAVLLYANDHTDQLPAGIENAREHLSPAEAQWLLENVVYLGKGLSVADYPGRAVAYDRTMLAEGKGTNVLYLDSHVDFENSQELERLGISSVRWDAALRTYEVNRRVADFPRAQDFSTPEAAYATINRIDRDDPSAWQKVSVAALAERFARQNGPRKTTGDPEWAKVLSYARILEVMVWDNTRAAVMAQLPQGLSSQKIGAPIDVRHLERENGRWLNTGNNRFWTIEEAKAQFMASLSDGEKPSARER
jgi:beta-lactamase regulating signal transducer with metallopeptidase domain